VLQTILKQGRMPNGAPLTAEQRASIIAQLKQRHEAVRCRVQIAAAATIRSCPVAARVQGKRHAYRLACAVRSFSWQSPSLTPVCKGWMMRL
jgi:hypothetical protein